MRVVAPYRPFPPESEWHREAAAFDWIAAIGMMRHSVARACDCSVDMLTDVDTVLPFPMLRYETSHRRLMLWSLEVTACYLASRDFDQDTVALDSDQLIFRSLQPWFRPDVDLTVLIRPRVPTDDTNNLPILNGVQWWAHAGRDRLVPFYWEALEIAKGLPDDRIAWGADTDALVKLLDPLVVGVHERAGVRVWMVDSDEVLETMSSTRMRWLKQSTPNKWKPMKTVLDFRGRRKRFMADVYENTIGVRVLA